MLLPLFMWQPNIQLKSIRSQTIDSLGACQGASWQDDRLYLYGDREAGVMRSYQVSGDSLQYTGREIRLTIGDSDLINHPTGIARQGKLPVFIGNSIRLNKEGTKWKAIIYQVNWEGLLNSGKLDGNLLKTIDDDTCIQGTRPEYVRWKNKWYVATADYGPSRNEVRLYDPAALSHNNRTSAPGVLVARFSCGPWVQNLHWINDKGILVLIQNQIEGRRWRFSFIDLEASLNQKKEVLLKRIDVDRNDELEGFTMFGKSLTGIAVSSSRHNNAELYQLLWSGSTTETVKF